jgi:tetratricopeptide (TPR) repeat protein
VSYCREALAVAQEMGERQTAGVYIGNMGDVYRQQGDYARATTCFVHALRIAVQLRDWTNVADQMANLAATAVGQGDHRQAERLFTRAIGLARLLDAPYFLCGWLHQLARLRVEQGRIQEAYGLNQEALEVADRSNEREVQVPAFLLSLRLQVELGRLDADAATRRLRALEETWAEPQEKALLLDAIWQLDPTRDATREAAADLYRTLYEHAPSIRYRGAYARLTGVTLPPGPPLPPLPGMLEEDVESLDELLRQVDDVSRQLGTT